MIYNRSRSKIKSIFDLRTNKTKSKASNSYAKPLSGFGSIFGKPREEPKKIISKKNMSYDQAKAKYPRLDPFGDADRDGVKNWVDCKPFDKRRQDDNIRNFISNDFEKWKKQRDRMKAGIPEDLKLKDVKRLAEERIKSFGDKEERIIKELEYVTERNKKDLIALKEGKNIPTRQSILTKLRKGLDYDQRLELSEKIMKGSKIIWACTNCGNSGMSSSSAPSSCKKCGGRILSS
jgi:rubrerythrin